MRLRWRDMPGDRGRQFIARKCLLCPGAPEFFRSLPFAGFKSHTAARSWRAREVFCVDARSDHVVQEPRGCHI